MNWQTWLILVGSVMSVVGLLIAYCSMYYLVLTKGIWRNKFVRTLLIIINLGLLMVLVGDLAS